MEKIANDNRPTQREAQEMLDLAHMLRVSAEETKDDAYILLFLAGAMALEARAEQNSFGFPRGLHG